jgi:hypothetical protein
MYVLQIISLDMYYLILQKYKQNNVTHSFPLLIRKYVSPQNSFDHLFYFKCSQHNDVTSDKLTYV